MTGFLDMPKRMRELWDWVVAGAAFDNGDPQPLADMIMTEEIPTEFVGMVADIISGQRKPTRKGKANLKIPAAERLRVAAALSVGQDLSTKIRRTVLHVDPHNSLKGAQAVGDYKNIEPKEVIMGANKVVRESYESAMQQTGVSLRTIKTLISDLKLRIDRWPIV